MVSKMTDSIENVRKLRRLMYEARSASYKLTLPKATRDAFGRDATHYEKCAQAMQDRLDSNSP